MCERECVWEREREGGENYSVYGVRKRDTRPKGGRAGLTMYDSIGRALPGVTGDV